MVLLILLIGKDDILIYTCLLACYDDENETMSRATMYLFVFWFPFPVELTLHHTASLHSTPLRSQLHSNNDYF